MAASERELWENYHGRSHRSQRHLSGHTLQPDAALSCLSVELVHFLQIEEELPHTPPADAHTLGRIMLLVVGDELLVQHITATVPTLLVIEIGKEIVLHLV